MPERLEERVVLSPTVYTVNVATDNGPTSAGSGSGKTGDLRYVINLADDNSSTSGSIIEFDPIVFATPQTINLSSSLGPLRLSETAGPEMIDGPTAVVTVSGENVVEVFRVSSRVTASVSGLTISGGAMSYGGGLYNSGTVMLSDCTVSDNSAAFDGGGLFNNRGTMTLTDCTISGNSASNDGGGLFNHGGTVALIDCTISADSSAFGGGLFGVTGP